MVMKNKRGWIRIVEAFVAILLISGTLLIVLNKGYLKNKDISSKVYDSQISVLREIELNDELRNEILNIPGLPTENISANVTNKILDRIPTYLECKAKICKMDRICELNSYPNKNVYAQAVAISATSKKYAPRQLKLFCWRK